MPSRREFGAAASRLFPAYAVLQHLFDRDLFAARHRGEGHRWLREVEDRNMVSMHVILAGEFHLRHFAALQDGFTFDVVVDNLDPTLGYRYEMDFVDPLHGEPAAGGRIRSRRITFEQALARYGPPRA